MRDVLKILAVAGLGLGCFLTLAALIELVTDAITPAGEKMAIFGGSIAIVMIFAVLWLLADIAQALARQEDRDIRRRV